MGYRKEKIVVENKMKRIKIIALFITAICVVGLCIFSSFYPATDWKYYFSLPKIEAREEGTLRLHFLDVGQGDCSLIEFPDGKVMLVDGGNSTGRTATTILRYLNALEIDTIDYLLLTHADSDHCGGLDTVIEKKNVKLCFIPKVKEDINTQYAEFYASMMERGCRFNYTSVSSIEIFSSKMEYPYTFSLLSPRTKDVEGEDKTQELNNDLSAVFWLDYFGTSALFTGDASVETETRLISESVLGLQGAVELSDTEILKVAHHGSKNSTSAEFLEYLNAKTAIISCSSDNPYGHPSSEVCTRLQTKGITDYRTYRDGHIVVTMDMNGSYEVETIVS